MELNVQHIAGKYDDDADRLSRWADDTPPPSLFRIADRFRVTLHNLWVPIVKPRVVPSDAFLLWKLPAWHAFTPFLHCWEFRLLLIGEVLAV